jgi:molybdopterin synthase catalytic subunit
LNIFISIVQASKGRIHYPSKFICPVLKLRRLGTVPVGEESVAVYISSEHRADSLAAVAAAIDTLKATVPIWKKEMYSDGSSNWKANPECAWK